MCYLYWLESYGCQMNMAEATAMEKQLSTYGWVAAKGPEEADLVILNTCAVRESAEKRIWGRIAYFKSIRRNHFRIAVMGCMAERLQDEMKKLEPAVDFVVGNFHKEAFINLLKDPVLLKTPGCEDLALDDQFHFAENHGRQSAATAFVPIMQGCNNFCTYCIVPYVRGREVSRDIDPIIEEINSLVAQGVKEITLLGQNVNSYRFERGGVDYDFPALLEAICLQTKVIWLRFTSSHPKDFSLSLVEVMARFSQICNHFHLPMQHGSNAVLKSMNRRYTGEEYLEKVELLREVIPGIGLSTDLLIGFPGETEDDFNQTLELVKKIRFDDAFTYYYNVRSGTEAAKMVDQLSEEVKKARLAILIDLQRSLAEEQKRLELGQVITVLVEKVSKKSSHEWLGRSEKNRMVVFHDTSVQVGEFCNVKLVSLKGSTFKGEVI